MASRKKKIEGEFHYKKITALASYIDRVGAEQLNFRKFMIKTYTGHYYTEKCTITIKPDGSIHCSNPEYEPTQEEAAAIRTAIIAVIDSWPKSIGAKNIDALIKLSGSKRENLSEFWSRKSGEVTFVQERRMKADGSKDYFPWTFFSDGIWRSMEPDGSLPFWKPRHRTKECSQIMIHEGAKTARFVDWLVNAKDAQAARNTHPWTEELAQYEHWGMIGGARAPGRTDYNELSAEKPTRVVYICDNDWPGANALEEVSRHWGGTLKGVFFDSRWPQSWDMADKFESSKELGALFSKKGSYIGPSLNELMFPATYATISSPNKKGKPTQTINEKFLQEWYHCIHPEVFIHRDFPNEEYDIAEFNNMVAPFSKAANTGLLVQNNLSHKTAAIAYDPSKAPGLMLGRDGKQLINTHVGSSVKVEKGDCRLWIEYIEHLLPDEQDRKETMKWFSTLVSHPEVKMHYSLLLISETQGVGKTTLGANILRPLIGERNVSEPSEVDIVESQFNGWCAQKRLAIVNEIYAGHNNKAYDRLKSITSDKWIMVNKKYQASYSIENWAHIFACSNSFRALKMSDDDRRWLIPHVTEKKKPGEFWTRLHEWIEEDNGLGKIKNWSDEFCKKNGYVRTGDAAPWSVIKKQVIEETMSQGMLLVSNLLDAIKELTNGEEVFVTDIQLVQYIKDRLYEGRMSQYLEKPLTLRKLARSKGWFINENVTQDRAFGAVGYKARLLFSRPEGLRRKPEELLAEGRKPFNLNEIDQI